MHKDTIPQKLHIAWRIYLSVTVVLQLLAIISFVSVRIIILNADYLDARMIANRTIGLLGVSMLILIALGLINAVVAIALYRRHAYARAWRRILIAIAAMSIVTLLIIGGTVANYFIERSSAVKQIHSDNVNGKFLPLTQPKSQE